MPMATIGCYPRSCLFRESSQAPIFIKYHYVTTGCLSTAGTIFQEGVERGNHYYVILIIELRKENYYIYVIVLFYFTPAVRF